MALSSVGLALLTTSLLAAGNASIEACPAKSDEAKTARRALAALDQQVRALGPRDDTSATVERLKKLLSMRCFEGTLESTRNYDGVSGEALTHWWTAGGEEWLRSYLELGEGSRMVVIPPDVRTTLEVVPGDASSAVVCAPDEACETSRAWKRRTQKAIDSVDKTLAGPLFRGFPERKDCLPRLKEIPKASKYSELRRCWEMTRSRAPLLPFGEVRLPTEGWLVLHGLRGKHSYCHDIRVYSLETGSAYVAKSCVTFELDRPYTVGDVPRRVHKVEITSGRVPLAALRDAALLLFIHKSIDEEIQQKAERLRLPKGLEAGWTADEVGWKDGQWRKGHTAQTTLRWHFQPPGGAAGEGTFTWPNTYYAPSELVTQRMTALEGRLIQGCPPEPLPVQLLRSAGVSSRNVYEDDTSSEVREPKSLPELLMEHVPEC